MPFLVDTHSHLNDRRLLRDVGGVLARAADNGVTRIICPGYDLATSRLAVELAQENNAVWATVGIHPHDAKSVTDDVLSQIAQLAQQPRVVAIGEIGLDYYRDLSPRPTQQDVFRQQLQLADSLGLPVVIHNRDAGQDILTIVEEEGPPAAGGVMHCFSEDSEYALTATGLGFYVGVAGPVTWPKSEVLRKAVRAVPLERLLVETDAPYLAPDPHRGKDNEPAFVRLVAERVAEVRGMTLDEISAVTSDNAEKLFVGLQ